MLRITCLLFFLPTFLFAQPVALRQDTTRLWAGGLNSPQVQKMDLNQDNIEDLVIFDRTTSRFFTFLARAVGKDKYWQYAPCYENILPATQGWFALRDYNQDGIKDFFAHASIGMQGYQAIKTAQGINFRKWAGEGVFTRAYEQNVNLQIAITDFPCLHDIDNDRDLDVITFEFGQGNFMELYQNMSSNLDTLQLVRQGCWGNLWEGMTCGDIRLENPCKGEGGGEPCLQPAHTGSSIALVDLNQDKRLDLLLGDVSCRKLYAVYNKGTNLKPVFSKIDTLFPASKPVDLDFPACFVEDVNFDNVPDLLVAPNVFRNEGNAIDFQRSLWFYAGKKKGKKTSYVFENEAFLQGEMIDVGENASPALWDFDNDGDFDLLVGNRGTRAGKFVASVYLYENVGTPQKPLFQLKDRDFGQLAGKQWTDIRLFTSDSNQDGKMELHLLAYAQGQTRWLYRQDSSEWQTFPYKLDKHEFPVLHDFDQDRDLDLLICKPFNEWSYWENTSQNTAFQWQEGKSRLRLPLAENSYLERFPIVVDLNQDKTPDLLITQFGNLTLYSDAQTQWREGKFWVGDDKLCFDTRLQSLEKYQLGTFAYPAVADLDADGRADVLVGLGTGGVCLFWNRVE